MPPPENSISRISLHGQEIRLVQGWSNVYENLTGSELTKIYRSHSASPAINICRLRSHVKPLRHLILFTFLHISQYENRRRLRCPTSKFRCVVVLNRPRMSCHAWSLKSGPLGPHGCLLRRWCSIKETSNLSSLLLQHTQSFCDGPGFLFTI